MTVKTKKKVEIQDKIAVLCDICGKNVDHSNFKDYQLDRVDRIRASIGEYYPEWDCRTTYALDVCGPCFLTRIKPAIETVVKFREYAAEDEEPFLTEGEVHKFL